MSSPIIQDLLPDKKTACFLVVDDELVIARDLASQLTRLGYRVVGIAASATRAIELVAKNKPDIVLMDIHLGEETDGISAAKQIRKSYGVPSIFVTAYADEQTLHRAQAAQPLGYIVKPIRAAELRATLLMSIAQLELTRALERSTSWLRALLSEISEGVIAADHSGAVRFMNKEAEVLTGTRREEAAGKPLAMVLLIDDQINQASERSRRAVVTASDGRRTPVEYTVFDLAVPDQVSSQRIIVFRDMTHRLRVEELLTTERDFLASRVVSTTAELDRTKEQLRALTADLMHVQEDERRRIARDLHDDIAQQLAGLQMRSERLATTSLTGDDFQRELTSLRSLFDSTSEHIRSLSHRLHPSSLEHLGLAVALQSLARDFRERHPEILVRVYMPEQPFALPGGLAIGIYRIVSEALRNVEKHASAPALSLRLYHRINRLRLSIRDYGCGFDVAGTQSRATGLGLISMQERSLAIGAKLRVYSNPSSGTLLTLAVHLEQPTFERIPDGYAAERRSS